MEDQSYYYVIKVYENRRVLVYGDCNVWSSLATISISTERSCVGAIDLFSQELTEMIDLMYTHLPHYYPGRLFLPLTLGHTKSLVV
jgi:hypothetical protein